ncbi:hypothetical protein [Mycobacterium sp.]|uniref:hypothetical protein n=1 Tax=Mycobacterium sp. TaxID=1785 RepID=UPI002CD0D235|nr:hypothetical protein [Mycobacterium sp.]HME50501.1 hypothetical protein [Mycobacterium sp.]
MTGPDRETRPISVAELLARNGTIGAPPVGGRRRRRRGNSDAVTVAELTGEIPAVQEDEHHDTVPQPVDAVPSNGTAEPAAVDEYEHDYEPEIDEHADYHGGSSVAEQMRPDPVVEDGHDEDVLLEEPPADEEDDDLPGYLRSIRAPLFGGPTRDERRHEEPDPVADEEARDGGTRSPAALLPDAPPETTTTEELAEHELPTTMQKALRAGLIVLQSVVAVAFGAGLFIAFDQLWKWNNIVALVLSVLVILGLVVAVRVVRKTEDIASTLIAVAVGALVTLGPLALLQSG